MSVLCLSSVILCLHLCVSERCAKRGSVDYVPSKHDVFKPLCILYCKAVSVCVRVREGVSALLCNERDGMAFVCAIRMLLEGDGVHAVRLALSV